MEQLQQEVEPAEVGLDAGRLARIDRHFGRYVEDGRLAGFLVSVARHGRVAHVATGGQRDREAGLPVETDTIWRMFSMTKPITSVALMMLVEEGLAELRDPVHRYLPAFRTMRVHQGGVPPSMVTRPATEPIRVWHLLTHTAGLTYGFLHAHPVDELYRLAGMEWGTPKGMDLAAVCDLVAEQPLLFDPGTEWAYSMATDVCGRLVEVLSGQRFDDFLAERVFAPLGMVDAGFYVAGDVGRLAALYRPDADRQAVPLVWPTATHPPRFVSGGGGMLATARDYHRFMEMLRGGGELEGTRLLGPRTVRYMATNHLPGGVDLETFGRPIYAETPFAGSGFGLGGSVSIDPVKEHVPATAGEFGWGGAASTAFWVDPVEDLTVQFLTQLLPSSTHPIRSQLHALVHQAIMD